MFQVYDVFYDSTIYFALSLFSYKSNFDFSDVFRCISNWLHQQLIIIACDYRITVIMLIKIKR